MYAPIVMFVYNRPDHFEKTYRSLAENPLARESDLYVFADGAKNEQGKAAVEKTREAVRSKQGDGKFKSLTLTEAPENRGLAASVISGVTEILNRFGKVIVIEDDNISSPYFLTFMNKALDFYEKDELVGAIAGFSPDINLPANTPDMYLAYRSCSCAWATWRRSFTGVDWELDDIADFYHDRSLVKKLNANGDDRFIRLYRQTKGNGSSWSVRFGAHLVKNGLFTLYPKYSYIQNIGCDSTGVHGTEGDAESMSVNLDKAIADPVFTKLTPDKNIQKLLKKHYTPGAKSHIKRILATEAILIKNK